MPANLRIELTRDEGLVLSDHLERWPDTKDFVLPMDYAERAAFVRLSGYLEEQTTERCLARTTRTRSTTRGLGS